MPTTRRGEIIYLNCGQKGYGGFMNLTNGEVPMGLGMALAQNTEAMAYFAGLSKEQQQAIIDGTHSIHSKEEMRAYVERLSQQMR